MTAPSDSSQSGLLGGRYRMTDRLGSGGMASVWRAYDERLDREVAVKLISDVLAEDQEYLSRFQREAQVAAQLSHPNLVGVFDFSAAGARPYLVMELIRDGSLADRIAANATAELDKERLARELLAALACVHDAGVVHRDLKPANVLIDHDGNARLTDFGIALPSDATGLTRTGNVLGTLKYMAPEVKRGEAATPRSDLYSAGLVLAEVDDGSDPGLSALIASLTAADPARRPRTAAGALAQLDLPGGASAAATEPFPPTKPTVPMAAPAAEPLSGRQRGPAAALIGLGAIAAAVVLALLLAGGDDEPRDGASAAGKEPATSSSSTEPASTVTTTATTTATAAAPAPPNEEPVATEDCAALEEQKKALDEERKAAEAEVADDKEAKKEVHDQYEEQKGALDEQIKACKEAEH